MENDKVSIFNIKKYLKERLPNYMVPSHITVIDSIPLTPNGKIDKKALASKSSMHLSNEYQSNLEPKSDFEIKLADIWKELLGIDKVQLNDTFFDLGGHSLLMFKSSQQVKDVFNIELPFLIYLNSTLEQIANEIALIKLKLSENK